MGVGGKDRSASIVMSPIAKSKKMNEDPYKTPQRVRDRNWAKDFLTHNNNKSSATKREKINYVMSRANELEEQALRMQKKIEMKNKQMQGTQNLSFRAEELLF